MKFFLEKSIFLGFIANILVVLIFSWVAYKRIQNNERINEIELHHRKVDYRTEKVLSIINEIENNAKGYVITSNEEYLTALDRNIYSANREIEYLITLFEKDKGQQKKIDSLITFINQKIQHNHQIIELRRYKDFDEAKNIITREKEIILAAEIDKILSEIRIKENLDFQEAMTEKGALDKRLGKLFIVLFFTLLILLLVVLFIIKYHLKKRKVFEIELEEKKQLLQSIIDNTTTPIFIKQLNGQYILVNKQFEKLFHYTNEQIKGKTDHQLFSKEIADSLRSADMDVVKAGAEMRFEEVFPQSDMLHTYIVVKFPLFDKEGKIYAVGGIATDISERKKISLLLQESEEQITNIFDAAPDAIIVIDQDSNIIKWNTKAENLFGWKAEEVIGKPMHKIIMPERYRDLHLNGMKHFLLTGQGPIINQTIEITALNKSDVEFDIELTVSYSLIKGKYIFIAFVKDIAKRKLLEKEIHQSKNFLNSIIENMPDMIFVKDAKELKFVTFNKAAEKLLGYQASEMIGKSDYDFFPKEQADFFTSKDRKVLNTGELVDIPEEEIDTKTGKRWLHTKKIPIKDEAGNPVYLLGISEDISQRKRLADERDEAEKLLRENEQRMKLILDNIGEGVVVADNKETIVLANPMAEEILGIKEQTHLPMDWSSYFEIYYPDGQTIFPAQNLPLEMALRGESTDEVEMTLYDPADQEARRIKATGRPIRDEENRIIAAVVTIRDITRYKELEQALQESETKYRKLIGFKRSEDPD